MINDITGWILVDEFPNQQLDSIFPLSKRAVCLIARKQNEKTILNTNFLNIQGAVEMMLGMDYHHGNFMRIVEQLGEVELTNGARRLKADLIHEVIAYLNRIGQFHYFLDSEFVKGFCSDANAVAPTLERFLPLRMKHSAHRSIDAPTKKDSIHFQETQAMSMSAIGPKHFDPKPGQRVNMLDATTDAEKIKFVRDNWKKCFLVCQFLTEDPKGALDFSIEREHPVIMQEAYSVIEKVLDAPNKNNKLMP